MERTRCNSSKVELPVAVGYRLLIERRIFTRDLYMRSRNNSPRSIHDGSANGSRPGWLLAGCISSRWIRGLLGLSRRGIAAEKEQTRA